MYHCSFLKKEEKVNFPSEIFWPLLWLYLSLSRTWCPCTVCWIEVKVAVLCSRQYIPWNLLIIKFLNNFWYFKHQILTRICSEAYLKHYWRNCLQKLYFILLSETISSIMFQIFFWASPSWILVFEISKIIQNFDCK